MNRTSRTEIAFLAVLVASACAVQCVVIQRAAVPALDAVRFVGSARLLGEAGLAELARSAPDAPLFAIWVAAAHAMLTELVGDFHQAWALSAQIASAIPLVLLPIPVYGLIRRLAGARPALYGTALVAFLPEVVRLGGDGISDSTHLLLLSLAIWLLAAAFTARRTESPAGPAVAVLAAAAGVSTGLAALIRAEAAVLALACAIVLAGGRFHPTSACHGRRFVTLFAYGLGFAAIAGFYALLARTPLTDWLPASSASAATGPAFASAAADPAPPQISLPGGENLCFAPKDPTISIRRRGWAAAPAQVLEQLAKATAYAPGLLALAGLLSLRRRPASAADRLLQIFTVLLLCGIFVHTAREGYLSARHLLPVCVAAAACMGHGIEVAASAVRRGASRFLPLVPKLGLGNPKTPWFPSFSLGIPESSGSHFPWFPSSSLGTLESPGSHFPWFPSSSLGTLESPGSQAPAWEPQNPMLPKLRLEAHNQHHPFESCLAAAIVLGIVAISLVDGTRPTHRTRLGHRLAAGWLATHAAAGQSVVDTQGLTGLYSGLPTIPYAASRAELGRDGLRYFVVEDQELRHASKRGHTLSLLLATAGQHVARFSAADAPDREAAGVSIYRWDASRFRAAAAHGAAGAAPEIRLTVRAGCPAGQFATAPGVFAECLNDDGPPARN